MQHQTPITHPFWVLPFEIPGIPVEPLLRDAGTPNQITIAYRHDIGGGAKIMYEEDGFHWAISTSGEEIKVNNNQIIMTMGSR